MRRSLATDATPRMHESAHSQACPQKVERSFEAERGEHRRDIVDDGPPHALLTGSRERPVLIFQLIQRVEDMDARQRGGGVNGCWQWNCKSQRQAPAILPLACERGHMSRETGADTSVLMRHLRNFGLHPMSSGVSETPKLPRPMRFPTALHALRTLTVNRIEAILGLDWRRWSPS